MFRPYLVALGRCISALAIVCSGAAVAQTFPLRPVTLVVPYSAGGAADILARQLAEALGPRLGQAVVVENRAGGNALVAARYVANSEPTGHTLLFVGGAVLSRVFLKDQSIDLARDFVPVAPLYEGPFVLAVSSKLPVNSVAELVAYARARPGELNYGAEAPTTMLSMEAFKAAAGLDIKQIPYRGATDVTAALLGDQVQMTFNSITTLRAHAAAGKLRLLAVGADRRLDEITSVPTMSESGFPGFLTVYGGGVWAPAKTPPATIALLNREIQAVAETEAFASKARVTGASAIVGPPQELTRRVNAQNIFWSQTAERARFTPQ